MSCSYPRNQDGSNDPLKANKFDLHPSADFDSHLHELEVSVIRIGQLLILMGA